MSKTETFASADMKGKIDRKVPETNKKTEWTPKKRDPGKKTTVCSRFKQYIRAYDLLTIQEAC